MSRTTCVACRHDIDSSAKLCPFCGADPRSGNKPVDTQAMLKKEFSSHRGTPSENLMQFARQRQGVVIAAGVIVAFLILTGVHAFVTRRNAREVSAASAIPLTEVTDLSNQTEENKPLPMPGIQYQFDGHPQTLRTFVVEPGAVVPPEILVAQQQAAQEAAAKQTATAAALAAKQPGAKPAVAPAPAGVPAVQPAAGRVGPNGVSPPAPAQPAARPPAPTPGH